MKTTPNPKATKNRRGELVALPPWPPPWLAVVVAALLDDEVGVGDIVIEVDVGLIIESVRKNGQLGCKFSRFRSFIARY